MNIPQSAKKHIIYWKMRYGSVFSIVIEEQSIIYRQLSLEELLVLQEHGKMDDIFEYGIINLCVLYPTPLKFEKTGSYSMLSNQIWDSSRWGKDNSLVQSIEENKEICEKDGTLYIANQVCPQIAEVLGCSVADIKRMPFDQFARSCALVELMTGKTFFETAENKKNDVLRKLGVERESPVEMVRPMTPEEYMNLQQRLNMGMKLASDALKNRIETEKSAEEVKPLDWEKDNQELMGQLDSQ